MASLNVIIFVVLMVVGTVLSKPMVGEVSSNNSNPIANASDDSRVPRMRISNEPSPIVHAGIANVNGRFGKSIRAFTVNEFEKYIGGLA